MKSALKESLAEYKIYKPHRASTATKDVLFFEPPYEARNPELVVHTHLTRPSIMDVMKEKHVPLKELLKTGESINDPEKFYKDARPKTALSSRMSTVSQKS
jgi:hypothetical protein